MIWGILLMGVVLGGSAVFSIWFMQKFSTGRQVDPMQKGDFLNDFQGQFDTKNPDSDSDKEYNGRD
jgi:hypothetical protein